MAHSRTHGSAVQRVLPFLAPTSAPAVEPHRPPPAPVRLAPLANRTDTSQAAAAAIAAESPTIRGEIYRRIVRAGSAGMTNEELARAIGRKESTVSARVNELHDKLNLIRDSGRRRKTTAGRDAIVWITHCCQGEQR